MIGRVARWVPPSNRESPVTCNGCGAHHFTVFYISELLGMQQCETCLRSQKDLKPATKI